MPEGRERAQVFLCGPFPASPWLALTWKLHLKAVFYLWTGQAAVRSETTKNMKMASGGFFLLQFRTPAAAELNYSSARK